VERITFLLNGQRLGLSRQQVAERLKGERPEPIQTWAVEVEGRLFPVKQALAIATGTSRGDFISHRARDLLRRLGFRVVDVRAEGAPTTLGPTAPPGAHHVRTGTEGLDIKLAALNAAIELYRGRSDASIEEVIEAARACGAWLTEEVRASS
jgi:hypothetical protein